MITFTLEKNKYVHIVLKRYRASELKSVSSSHPYYKLENTNWQNSIRYQLSINESFAKAEEGHGKYWMLSNNLQGKLKKSKYLKHLESTKNPQ